MRREQRFEEEMKEAMLRPSDYVPYTQLMAWEERNRRVKNPWNRHKSLQKLAREILERQYLGI